MKTRPILAVITALLLTVAAACGSSGSDGGDSGTTTTKATSSTTKAADDTTTTAGDAMEADAPTEAEISAGMQKGLGVDAKTGDCTAKELKDAVSAESLQAIASADQSKVPADELEAVQKAITDAIAACK